MCALPVAGVLLSMALAAEPSPPAMRGRGLFGAAAGLHVLGAVGSLASTRMVLRRCVLPSEQAQPLATPCTEQGLDAWSLSNLGSLVGRGAIALTAVGGDHAGHYGGARDAGLGRPARADLRRLRIAGGVALGLGAVVSAVTVAVPWVVLPRCRTEPELGGWPACATTTMHASWAADVVAGGAMAVGAGLLTYTSGYAGAHRRAMERRMALTVSPRLSRHHLGLATGLRF